MSGRGLAVMHSPCGECLFSDARIVSTESKAAILAECARDDTHFLCHKGTIAGQDIVCAGFFTRHTSRGIRLARVLGVMRMVDGPEVQP